MIEHLLQPGYFGKLKVKNRIVYSGMTFKLGDNKGHLTQAEVDSMVYRAKQEYGPGIITFPGLNESMFGNVKAVNINSDEAMYVMAKHVEQVKVNGTKAMAILGVLSIKNTDYSANCNLGASNLTYPYTTVAMTKDEIDLFIYKFGQMARRAKEAGFDAIRIQTGVAKKAIDLFLSPYTNRRTDEYGGDIMGRTRLLREVLTEVRRQAGADMPIMLELRVKELVNNGIPLEEGLELVKILAPYVDVFEPTVGRNIKQSALSAVEPYYASYGTLLPYVKAVKDVVPDKTVIATVKMGIPSLADRVIAEGQADFVSLGRPLFVDPEWITKAAKGEDRKILKCIGCMNCFTEQTRKEVSPTCHRACTVNPNNLREEDFYHPQPAKEPKRVLVVGGGLAGMEASIRLAKRGHDVTLCEKKNVLGGQWIPASRGPEKGDYRTLVPYKENELEEAGVKVLRNQEVDKAYLQSFGPDITVLATGAVPKSLSFEKPLGDVNIVQGNDVLMDEAKVGQRVVVIGARYIGMEAAVKLAKEGKDVSLVDMTEIGKGTNPVLFDYYIRELIENKVALYPNCAVMDFSSFGVDITYQVSLVTLPADTIVLAIGTKPENSLVSVLEELKLPYCAIGDCKRIGDALYAIRDGAELGHTL